MSKPADQRRARSELPGPLVPGLVPPLLGVLVQVIWTAGSHEPRGLVNARLIDLGHTDGVSDPHPS
jgi:hypothetical protein